MSLEFLLLISLSLRVSFYRVLLLELTRCLNGFLCMSCMLMDLGAITPLLWSFEERDKFYLDCLVGTRMHLSYVVLVVLRMIWCVDFVDVV